MVDTLDSSAAPALRLENERYRSNTYLLSNRDAAVVIDPGQETAIRIANFLQAYHIPMLSVLLTHEHFDHISGVLCLLQRFPEGELICSQVCSDRIISPRLNLSRYMTGIDFVCVPATTSVEQLGMEMAWEAAGMNFLLTPGHSPGSICIQFGNLLFTGDTILPDGPGLARLPGGSAKLLRESLNYLQGICKEDTVICPGHGLPFRSTNAVLPMRANP